MALTGPPALVVDAALGVWLGSVVFFSFFVAPRAFEVLEDDDAARFVTDVFPRYYLLGIVLAVVTIATVSVTAGSGFDPLGEPVGLAATVGLAANGYARFVLVPQMERAAGEEFWRYHTQSVLLNGLTLLAVAGGLAAANLP